MQGPGRPSRAVSRPPQDDGSTGARAPNARRRGGFISDAGRPIRLPAASGRRPTASREDLMTAYWPSLGKYVEGLEKAGKLVRITSPVNKDTELHPLVRLQFRGLPESQRKAFPFENVVDD